MCHLLGNRIQEETIETSFMLPTQYKPMNAIKTVYLSTIVMCSLSRGDGSTNSVLIYVLRCQENIAIMIKGKKQNQEFRISFFIHTHYVLGCHVLLTKKWAQGKYFSVMSLWDQNWEEVEFLVSLCISSTISFITLNSNVVRMTRIMHQRR